MKIRTRLFIGIFALSALFVVFLFWPNILFGLAASTADGRPALLVDARWNEPESTKKFQARFHRGTETIELVDWLSENKFVVDIHRHFARRAIGSFPCNENAVVSWESDNNGQLVNAQAKITEAGCL